MRKKTFARSRNSAHCTLFKLSQGLNKHHHLPSFCHLPTFPAWFSTSPRRSLPFSFRALFEAELQFSELILFWRIIVVLGGEGEVGRLEQVTPSEKGEKVQKKVREREKESEKRALVFAALWRGWTVNNSARGKNCDLPKRDSACVA